MIPKVIHYCWFGRGKKPALVKKCIASWRKYCPDYEIIEWNEDNFDLAYSDYTKFCYKNGRWAFLSDLARLLVVYENGGIYFDTDVELIASPTPLLDCGAFYGFENDRFISTGLGFGAEKGHPTLKKMIERYARLDVLPDGSIELIGCPHINTETLADFGFRLDGTKQTIGDTVVYPREYFNPMDDATGRMTKTENTYSINRYGKSWMSKKSVVRSRLTRPFHRLFGIDVFARFRR